ncbi:hypothetical protein ACTJKK_10515 [Microbacterium sp. 22179]|uniref:hypothetical protein n=1 Tax=Microbacterium sp. 22179 TaxID=3453886 RepID=UPI003F864774
MSGSDSGADMPTGAEAEERIAELLEQRQRDGVGVDDVPAGGGGADSGAAGAVGVDDDTDAAASADADSYDSAHNDEPGVGNRHP